MRHALFLSLGSALALASAAARATNPGTHVRTFVSDSEFAQDCTAAPAERLAPLEAAVARAPKNGRLDRAGFSAQWTEAGSSVVIRLERGRCDCETIISASPMDNADRLDQRDAMIGILGRMFSEAHGREAGHLFEDANDVVVSSDPRGDVITMWSSRRTERFPEGAWLELGPETSRMVWQEKADPKVRVVMLEALSELRKRHAGKPLEWRRRATPVD